jgi:hypothetical protein
MRLFFILFIFAVSSTLMAQGMDGKPYKAKMKQNIHLFQSCFTEALKLDSQLSGKVVLDWDVDDKGKVVRAAVKKSEIEDYVMEKCLIEKLKSLSFPPASKGLVATVQYPLVFSSGK